MSREPLSPGMQALYDMSQKRVDETAKQRHEQEPVIDRSAAIRIATSLGWAPKRTWVGLSDEDLAGCTTEEYETARYWESKLRSKNT